MIGFSGIVAILIVLIVFRKAIRVATMVSEDFIALQAIKARVEMNKTLAGIEGKGLQRPAEMLKEIDSK